MPTRYSQKATITNPETKKQVDCYKNSTMAPGLVDPPQGVPALNSTKASVGPKEAFVGGPQVFNKIAEEKGTGRHPPATHPEYLPVWGTDTKYAPTSLRYWRRDDLLTSITDIHLLSRSRIMSMARTLILVFRICLLRPLPLPN